MGGGGLVVFVDGSIGQLVFFERDIELIVVQCKRRFERPAGIQLGFDGILRRYAALAVG